MDAIRRRGNCRLQRAVSSIARSKLLRRARYVPSAIRAEMLRTVRPQLVLVALESRLAPPAIRIALEHDAHVLAEKPACVRASDFAALTELAGETKSPADARVCDSTSAGTAQRARKLIADNEHRTAVRSDRSLHRRPDATDSAGVSASWFASRERAGGGHLAWLGIHYVDLIQFVTAQKIVEVSALTANAGGQPCKSRTPLRLRSGWTAVALGLCSPATISIAATIPASRFGEPKAGCASIRVVIVFNGLEREARRRQKRCPKWMPIRHLFEQPPSRREAYGRRL